MAINLIGGESDFDECGLCCRGIIRRWIRKAA